jgi:hypothetical protein
MRNRKAIDGTETSSEKFHIYSKSTTRWHLMVDMKSSLGDQRASKIASNDDVVLGARACTFLHGSTLNQKPQLAIFGRPQKHCIGRSFHRARRKFYRLAGHTYNQTAALHTAFRPPHDCHSRMKNQDLTIGWLSRVRELSGNNFSIGSTLLRVVMVCIMLVCLGRLGESRFYK